jgi:hypothetical protein
MEAGEYDETLGAMETIQVPKRSELIGRYLLIGSISRWQYSKPQVKNRSLRLHTRSEK